MPEMSPGKRAAGGQVTGAAIDPDSLLPWINGTFPPLRKPDQSRYGTPGTCDSPRMRNGVLHRDPDLPSLDVGPE